MPQTHKVNVVNRRAALHNINILCPPLAIILNNTYNAPIRLIITGDGEIMSTEGTTQGDTLAMSMYALATTPLIDTLRDNCQDIHQVWYADDATCASTCLNLKHGWDELSKVGPLYGYHPNPTKTCLIVKPEFHTLAKMFKDTNIQISTDGYRHLGAVIGSGNFTEKYVNGKVNTWITELKKLSLTAITHPHAAYAAFIHGMSNQW